MSTSIIKIIKVNSLDMLSKAESPLPRQLTSMLMIAALVYRISGGLATLSGLAFPAAAN